MITTFWDSKYTYAVIGASNSPEKYGHKVLANLLSKEFKCIPINPKKEIILGKQSHASVLDVQDHIDVAVFITPPAVTLAVLKECKKKGIVKAWMQPGSESDEAIAFCIDNEIDYSTKQCMLIK